MLDDPKPLYTVVSGQQSPSMYSAVCFIVHLLQKQEHEFKYYELC